MAPISLSGSSSGFRQPANWTEFTSLHEDELLSARLWRWSASSGRTSSPSFETVPDRRCWTVLPIWQFLARSDDRQSASVVDLPPPPQAVHPPWLTQSQGSVFSLHCSVQKSLPSSSAVLPPATGLLSVEEHSRSDHTKQLMRSSPRSSSLLTRSSYMHAMQY